MDRYTFAIIPTNGRPCHKRAFAAIREQVDRVIIVEGGPDAKTIEHQFVVREPELNISRWWNLGLTLAASQMQDINQERRNAGAGDLTKWDVAIINDDAIVPEGWFRAVSEKMREMKAAAACSGTPYAMSSFHTHAGPVDLHTRMQGYAFVLAGEKGVRANEKLKWYFSDDHVDWMSRQLGGMVNIPGYVVEHLHPNGQMTPELQAQTAEDAAEFVAYWGARPW